MRKKSFIFLADIYNMYSMVFSVNRVGLQFPIAAMSVNTLESVNFVFFLVLKYQIFVLLHVTCQTEITKHDWGPWGSF